MRKKYLTKLILGILIFYSIFSLLNIQASNNINISENLNQNITEIQLSAIKQVQFTIEDIERDINIQHDIPNWIVNPVITSRFITVTYDDSLDDIISLDKVIISQSGKEIYNKKVTNGKIGGIVLEKSYLFLGEPKRAREILKEWKNNKKIDERIKRSLLLYYYKNKPEKVKKVLEKWKKNEEISVEEFEQILEENCTGQLNSIILQPEKIRLDPYKIFGEDFTIGNKKELTITVTYNYQGEKYEKSENVVIEVLPPLPVPPSSPLSIPEKENYTISTTTEIVGDIH